MRKLPLKSVAMFVGAIALFAGLFWTVLQWDKSHGSKASADEPDEAAYRLLEGYLAAGIEIVKLWAAPRGRDRGLVIDAPWRVEGVRRLGQAVRKFRIG